MKPKKKKRKIKWKNIIKSTLIFTLIIFFIIKLIIWNSNDEELTYSLEYGEILVEDEYRALVIRKELVLTSNTSGYVTQIVDDGEKIKKNQRIIDITNSDVIITSSTEVNENEIVEIKTIDKSKVEMEIALLKEDIASKVKSGDYSELATLSEELKLKIENLEIIKNDKNLEESSYSETSVGSGSLGTEESESIYAPKSGIFTYYLDGYEDDFTYERVIYLEYDQIQNLDIKPVLGSDNIIEAGDKICKIIDDSSWYIIVVVERGDQNNYDLNSELEVTIGDRVISGYIEEIFPTSTRVAIAIKFEENIEDFYKKRFLDVKISQNSFKGLKINNSSIVRIDGRYGVYVVDKYNKVIFRPIKILYHDGEFAVVKKDAFYEVVEDENIKIETVSIYDRVIIDSYGFSEGDVIK